MDGPSLLESVESIKSSWLFSMEERLSLGLSGVVISFAVLLGLSTLCSYIEIRYYVERSLKRQETKIIV